MKESTQTTLTDSVQRLEAVQTSSSEATKDEREYGKGSDKETEEIYNTEMGNQLAERFAKRKNKPSSADLQF